MATEFQLMGARHEALMSCRGFVLDALCTEMANRSLCQDLSWIDLERQAVAMAANRWADAHGFRHVTVADIEHIEVGAVGHVDYASKLALYVAEYVTA
jgi:hypothetical protein